MDDPRRNHERDQQRLGEHIGGKEARKLKARREPTSIWFGLGMFGIIGWSVSIPTLLGILIGVWIDTSWPSRFSWTLMLLLAGVILGCWNAWHWVAREQQSIEQDAAGTEEDEHDLRT
jgi:ATP synthase protein I